jgi:HIV Tat-specific factor 1
MPNRKGEEKQGRKVTAAEPVGQCSVYVEGLPDDATEREVANVLGRAGVVREHPDSGKKHVKLYGKGDALVVFLRQPSVQLAIDVLDGTPLRLGDTRPLRISSADFSHKSSPSRSTHQKKRSKNKRPRDDSDAKQRKQRHDFAQRQALHALSWGEGEEGEEENEHPALQLSESEKLRNIAARTVLLKPMFTLDQMASDPVFKQDLEDDIAQECAKLGRLENVHAHSTNPDGVVQVRYASANEANECALRMRGRFFDKQQIEAFIWDGETKLDPEETPEEEEQRLERFGRELESGGNEDGESNDDSEDDAVNGTGG